MRNVEIIKTTLQFKNPITGQPTKAIADHYYARRIFATVDGGELNLFRFMANELPFEADEDVMITAIEAQLVAEAGAMKPTEDNAE